jgi:hypothetical protein
MTDVIIEAEVDMGTTLILDGPSQGLNPGQLLSCGCDSVKGRRTPTAEWEYVVYESKRVRVLGAEGLSAPASPRRAPPATSYITGLTVVMHPDKGPALRKCPPGYQVLMVDLCKGTKRRGWFVYLCYKRGSDVREAIGDIMLEAFDDEKSSTFSDRWHQGEYKPFTRIASDLNRGAHGKYIYLNYSQRPPTARSPITEVQAIVWGERPPSLAPRWEYVTWQGTSTPADTNKGAGGPYIFISFKRE